MAAWPIFIGAISNGGRNRRLKNDTGVYHGPQPARPSRGGCNRGPSSTSKTTPNNETPASPAGQFSHATRSRIRLLHFAQTISAVARVLLETMPLVDLEGLYDGHASALFAFLLTLTRNEADTRDLMQELFAKLARQPVLLDGVRDERAFLLRLSHHAAIDAMRRRGTRDKNLEQLEADSAGAFAPSADADEQAFREALSEALHELPPQQRAVVHLKLWEGLTFEAIAEALDLPLKTAASRYRYGIDKLRQRLRPLYEEIK